MSSRFSSRLVCQEDKKVGSLTPNGVGTREPGQKILMLSELFQWITTFLPNSRPCLGLDATSPLLHPSGSGRLRYTPIHSYKCSCIRIPDTRKNP
ncbi:hypothetical protein XENOCAPTIV_027147 [Xenoophorus captivus]|uniref:Uncharacterized protein n=1 Tax=Xenoophorus captivus TaxID=1517983 RepID=A0ABV0QN85_9TELE